MDSQIRFSFPTPVKRLKTGTGLQEFRVRVRKTGAGASAQVRLELYEGGSLVAEVLPDTTISSEQTVSARWDASLLTQASGVNVELRVVGTGLADSCLEVAKDVLWVTAEITDVETFTPTLAAVLTAVPKVTKDIVRPLSAALTDSAFMAKLPQKRASADLLVPAFLSRRTSVFERALLTLVPTMRLLLFKALISALNLIGSVLGVRARLSSPSASVAILASLRARSNVALHVGLSVSANVLRSVFTALRKALALEPALAAAKLALKSHSAQLGVVATSMREALQTRRLVGTLSLPTSWAAVPTLSLHVALSATAVLRKGVAYTLKHTLSLLPSFIRELLGTVEPEPPFFVEVLSRRQTVEVLSEEMYVEVLSTPTSVEIISTEYEVDVESEDNLVEVV